MDSRAMPTHLRPTALRPASSQLDLSKIRHDLRTPINHILGYCEMLQEEEAPPDFQADLQKIHAGGKQLMSLIAEYFDEETFDAKQIDLHQLCHELRTPVNHIVGYTELLEELAEERGLKAVFSDLDKIREASRIWLELMEEYLVLPQVQATKKGPLAEPAPLRSLQVHPGIGFAAPAGPNAFAKLSRESHLLVVDDDESNREMLSRRLVKFGCRVSVAATGLEALKILRTGGIDMVMLDMIMPGLDGYQVLTKIKTDPQLAEIPVIMISALDQENSVARCLEAGAEDYVPKPFNSVLLRARIGASLERRHLRNQERRAYEALRSSQERLTAELAGAAAYVQSLLPAPLEGEVRGQWRFLPCAELGGDIFGYHWINPDRLAIYLVDVSGHGVSPALLSVSVFNVLRTQSLRGTDFSDPAAVLNQLNRVFQMEHHNNLLFTLWYGVFDRTSRQLTYASGGHPPAVLTGEPFSSPQRLATGGRVIGCDPDAKYQSQSCRVEFGGKLYVFSDGVYEILRPDGRLAQLEDLIEEIGRPSSSGGSKLDGLVAWARNLSKLPVFEDDVSLLEIAF
jgi:sigma-B regulation protein RsbU (phosphoserine phosphatase)